jgi:hypothetical protein
MRFQKSKPAGAATISASLCLDGPIENMDASTTARKAQAREIHEKAGSTPPHIKKGSQGSRGFWMPLRKLKPSHDSL